MKDEGLKVEELPDRQLAVLRVQGELEIHNRKVFKEASQALVDAPYERLVLDLTGVTRLFSMYIGSVADLHQRSVDAGKSLTILVTAPVLRIFEQTNLNEVLNLVQVDTRS